MNTCSVVLRCWPLCPQSAVSRMRMDKSFYNTHSCGPATPPCCGRRPPRARADQCATAVVDVFLLVKIIIIILILIIVILDFCFCYLTDSQQSTLLHSLNVHNIVIHHCHNNNNYYYSIYNIWIMDMRR